MKMIHRNTQSVACGLSVWCDTPWIRVRPYEGNEYRLPEEDPAVPGSMKVSALTAEQMTAHRLRGHTPYMSHPARFVRVAREFIDMLGRKLKRD